MRAELQITCAVIAQMRGNCRQRAEDRSEKRMVNEQSALPYDKKAAAKNNL